VVGGKGVGFDQRLGGKPSSGLNRWLNNLGGIVRVVFRLKTRWVPNVWIVVAEAYSIPNTGKMRRRVSAHWMTRSTKVSTAQWTAVNAIDSSPRESLGVLFIGAIRGSGTNV
jgi:hypothetical protein